jgi:[protein-PII] uridylyltransferase
VAEQGDGGSARSLREARERIHGFQRGSDRWGSRTTRLYTAAVDNCLREGFAGLVRDGVVDPDWLARECCVVATGGYARKMLCPWSDVDVLLVTAQPEDPRLPELARRLLYPLWDAGLEVGQRPGTVEQIVEAAEGDVASRTSLLDLRLIAGSRTLYDRVHRCVDTAIERWRPELLDQVLPLNLARFARYGQSVFLLEPHVKEGKGGLRDFHWLGWITRLSGGLRGDYDLLLSGLVEPQHYRELLAAHEFLLRVRVQLHLHRGRADDRLLFEYQEPVARALGFRRAAGLRPVENFMGRYYRHAWTMAHTCGLYVRRSLGLYWDEPPHTSSATLELGPSAPSVRAGWDDERDSDDGLFVLRRGAVRCTDPEAMARDPRRVLALFEFLQQVGGRLHHDTNEDVRAALRRVDARFRRDPNVGRRFRALFEGPHVFRTLAAMHRSGFLGRYVPEFGACFCQAQHNRVHLYTVDVHSLYVVRELEALGGPDARRDAPVFAGAWSTDRPRAARLMAGLLHDVGKAAGSAHSRVGADLAGEALARMGFGEEEIKRIQWLVRHHLLLSDVAYHRDIYDPKTIGDLVAVIPDRTHLDDLLALTWADSRATNPTLLTSWKQGLLEQAYSAALAALPGRSGRELGAVDVVRAQVVRAQLEALLSAELPRKKAAALAGRTLADDGALPGYLERTPPEELAVHAVLLDRLGDATAPDGVEPSVTQVRHLARADVSQWCVCTRDRPGLFSRLAGVLTASGLSIRSAEARTRRDGICIDTFAVTGETGGAVRDVARWRRVARLLERVEAGQVDLDDAVERTRRSGRPVPDPGAVDLIRVDVGNDLSDVATVVEVVVPDRIGLVYDITQVLLGFRLDLRVAKIATRVDLASDTFYVVGRGGRQVGRRRCRELAAELRRRFLA